MPSYGQSLLKQYLETILWLPALEDHRPDWLRGLEIDLFFPSRNLAFEFQGAQHFLPVYGQSGYCVQRSNDWMKQQICRERGITLRKIEAIDLQCSKLIVKLKRVSDGAQRRAQMANVRGNLVFLRALDQQAIEYRKILKKNYGDPTAQVRRNRKANKRKWREAHGLPTEVIKSDTCQASQTAH